MLCSSLWGWTWTPWLQSRRLVCETRKIHPSVHWRIGPHPGRSAFIWCKKSKSPSALLEMFHEFSIISNFCRKQGCWGGFLYHAFSRIRIFFPETLRWLSPLIILISFGVQLDLCSFNQCPLTWIFLDESWHPYHPSKGCCLSRQSFRTDHPCNQLKHWSLHQKSFVSSPQPSHSSRGTDGNWSTAAPPWISAILSQKVRTHNLQNVVSLQHSSSFLQVH